MKLSETRSRMLPKEVRASDVLSDLQLALWPTKAIAAALQPGVTFTALERGDGSYHFAQRTFANRDSTYTVINYGAFETRWGGTITLENTQYHYRLVIKSAEAK